MIISHAVSDILIDLFPQLKGKMSDIELVTQVLTDYYTYGPYKPKVTIKDKWVTIEIDAPAIFSQETDYHKVVALCEKGRYKEAKPILKKLIEQNPTNSEYYRIMGQILSDEGDQENAIDALIDALRWNPGNGYALTMLGNIFARHKDDLTTAMSYYDQAIKVNPKDYIAINNIGANLLQKDKIEEAKKYFFEALKISQVYPNTHFALGMIAEMENDLPSAFYSTIEAIKVNKNRDVLYQNSVRQAFEIAKRVINSKVAAPIVRNYLHKLEFEGGKEIEMVEDSEIHTTAKFELAENHSRDKHIIRYKPESPAIEHLIMHELVHLEYILEAQKADLNQVFVSNPEQKTRFIRGLESTTKKLRRQGLSEEVISNYCSGLFAGINTQALNTPIDLFIENFIFSEYSEMHPYQFLSLYSNMQQGMKSVTDKKILELSPADIVSKSKIYNLVNALQFKELYGMDFISDFQATSIELKHAKDFYDEYLQYRDDRGPGEEYDLVQHWAEDLHIEKYFELIPEKEYRTQRTDLNSLLESIENDPFGVETKDPHKEREMEKFQRSQKELGTNMAVVMFMVDALQYFKSMPKEKIREIAFEIAMQGTQGYNPDNKGYKLSTVPGKEFSGYHIMAWYYVSWMLTSPELVPELELPFDAEYKIALTMYKPHK